MNTQLIRLSFLAAITMSACFFSCKTKKAEADKKKEVLEKLAKNPNIGAGTGTFEITAPEGWTKNDTSFMGFNATFLMSPVEGASDIFQENLNVVTERAQGATIDRYLESSKSYMEKGLSGFSISGNGETDINGEPAKWLDYSHSSSGYNLDVRVWFLIKNNMAYVITGSALKGEMSKWLPKFQEAANTFRVQE